MEEVKNHTFLAWAICVLGWLICAALCLYLTLELEHYPYAYDMLLPAILLILFCNIFLFLFIATRWKQAMRRLINSVIRLCLGEALLLAGMYALGRFCT